MRRGWFVLICLIAVLIMAGTAQAAGTPTWWDNPGGRWTPYWHQIISTGQAKNQGLQTQYLEVVVDIPNNCPPSEGYKNVWVQISWNIGPSQVTTLQPPEQPSVLWTNAACPATTADPFPSGPSATLVDEGSFVPAAPYLNGDERSYDIPILSSPPGCERVLTRFLIDANQQLDYKVESQTVCSTPTAVHVTQATASRPAWPWAAGLGIVVACGALVVVRRRA